MKKIFLFALSALTLSACVKEADNLGTSGNNQVDTNNSTFVITASRSEVLDVTKTTLGNDGQVSWAVGDKLMIVCADGTCVETNAVETAGLSASFTAEIPEGKEAKWAVYPSTVAVSVIGGDVSVTVPSVQDGKFENASIEVGEIVDSEVALKNVCSLLMFTVPTFDDGEAGKVYLGGNGAPLAGTVKATKSILAESYTNKEDVSNAATTIQINVTGPGTYYAAVLPNSINGPVIQIYTEDKSTILGERISSKVLNAPRKHVKELVIADIARYFEKRFITPDGAGTKDGKSWENAWSYSNLRGKISNNSSNGGVKLTNHMLFVAEGTVSIPTLIEFMGGTKFKIYGGFPSGLSGQDISARDITRYSTVFDGGGTQRLFNCTNAGNEILFDGLSFNRSYQNGGDENQYTGCCLLMNQGAYSFINCKFEGNNKAIGGAILRVGGYDNALAANSAKVRFERCVFANNKVASKGQIAVGYGGNLAVKDCDFTNNNVSGQNDARIVYTIYKGSGYASPVTITDEGGNTFANGQKLK